MVSRSALRYALTFLRWAIRPIAVLVTIESSQLQTLFGRLIGFAISRGLQRSDAEDCAQETLLVLARKYSEKDEPDLVPIAFRTIRWKIWESRRRKSTSIEGKAISVEGLSQETGREVAGGEDPEEIAILKEAMHRALDQLARKCRKLLLWQLEGFSGEEIAQKAGLRTRNAAYIAMSRCKRKFKQAYEKLQRRPR